MTSKVKLMTQAEYATHRGCSAVAVHKAAKEGRISLIDSKIDPAVADIQWARNTRVRAPNRSKDAPAADAAIPASVSLPAQSLRPAPGNPALEVDGYHLSRARREAAEAAIAEMKEAEMRSRYLVKSDVDAVLFEVARALRDGLTNCARRLAAEVAGLGGAGEIEEVIDREHRALLESMTHRLATRLQLASPEQEVATP